MKNELKIILILLLLVVLSFFGFAQFYKSQSNIITESTERVNDLRQRQVEI
jgi:TM2 domain-containing membrane protein YozV